MSRAKWKGPFISNQLLLDCKKAKSLKKSEIYTKSRNSTIVPFLINLTIYVYNGKTFSKVKITKQMIGHKLRKFSPTRKKFSFKKKKKNKDDGTKKKLHNFQFKFKKLQMEIKIYRKKYGRIFFIVTQKRRDSKLFNSNF